MMTAEKMEVSTHRAEDPQDWKLAVYFALVLGAIVGVAGIAGVMWLSFR